MISYAARQFTRRITCRIWSWIRARLRWLIARITRRIVQRLGRWIVRGRLRRIVQGGPAWASAYSDFGPQTFLLASVTKTNALADAIVPERRAMVRINQREAFGGTDRAQGADHSPGTAHTRPGRLLPMTDVSPALPPGAPAQPPSARTGRGALWVAAGVFEQPPTFWCLDGHGLLGIPRGLLGSVTAVASLRLRGAQGFDPGDDTLGVLGMLCRNLTRGLAIKVDPDGTGHDRAAVHELAAVMPQRHHRAGLVEHAEGDQVAVNAELKRPVRLRGLGAHIRTRRPRISSGSSSHASHGAPLAAARCAKRALCLSAPSSALPQRIPFPADPAARACRSLARLSL
jgi:hypothetical protein